MARRSAPDALAPQNALTWLVVRNAVNETQSCVELAPNADLRRVLNAERDARIAAGWVAEPIGNRCSFFFCTKDGLRLEVGIMRRDPKDALFLR
jgi:hypothetical protein